MKTFEHTSWPVTLAALDRLDDAIAKEWLEAWSRGDFPQPNPVVSGPVPLAVPQLPLGHVLCKSYRAGTLARLLRTLSGVKNRPRRSFEIGCVLEAAGVRASRPLALLERRRCGLVTSSCVVFEPIQGVTLRDYLLDPAHGSRRSDLWTAIAVEVARLHAACVRQRDLKAPNVIVSEESEVSIRISLIDLDGMTRLSRAPSLRTRARDLARLAASFLAAGETPADWRMLLEQYLRASGGTPPEPREVARLHAWTLAWARHKLERNRRQGRPVW